MGEVRRLWRGSAVCGGEKRRVWERFRARVQLVTFFLKMLSSLELRDVKGVRLNTSPCRTGASVGQVTSLSG